MESLSDTLWDVVICGTGLQQSLLALALSRSGKKILHVDPNEYYGGPDASFSLQEMDEWAAAHAGAGSVFSAAQVTRPPPPPPAGDDADSRRRPGLSFPRAYTLTLSPQTIYARSTLLARLVSSRAYRQLEFLAVGSAFVVRPSSSSSGGDSGEGSSSSSATRPFLVQIPATREAIFSSAALSAKSKRALMKFLKFVVASSSETDAGGSTSTEPTAASSPAVGQPGSSSTTADSPWAAHASEPLSSFLGARFGLDAELQGYVHALTLSLAPSTATSTSTSTSTTPATTVAQGLAALRRHLASWGVFGPGFSALYAKWGGGSEVAQVACRAGAVGGGVYALGRGVRSARLVDADVNADAEGSEDSGRGKRAALDSPPPPPPPDSPQLELQLTDGTAVRTRLLVRGWTDGGGEEAAEARQQQKRVGRLVAVVDSPMPQLFEPTVEGAPTPAVAVVSLGTTPGGGPVYALVHSSDAGECPVGQCVVYLTCLASTGSKAALEQALASLLAAADLEPAPRSLYQVYYEQSRPLSRPRYAGQIFEFPPPALGLAFDDASLDPVREAWRIAVGDATPEDALEFMVFEDRDGTEDDDDVYD